MAGFARMCVFLASLLIYNFLVNAGQTTTRVVIGQDGQLVCNTRNEQIRWTVDGKNVTKGSNKRITWEVRQVDETRLEGPVFQHVLTVAKVEAKDAGNYTCLDGDEVEQDVFSVEPIIEPRVLKSSPSAVRVGLDKSATLFCYMEFYPIPTGDSQTALHDILYFRRDEESDATSLRNATKLSVVNQSHVNMTLHVQHAAKRDNGTYLCLMNNPRLQQDLLHEITLLVLDIPQLRIDLVRAVGMDKIFLNWTVNDGNANVTHYRVQYLAEGEPTFTYYASKIPGNATSLVLHGFRASTNYKLKMQAINSVGDSRPYEHPDFVRTLEKDPDFVPVVDVKGSTHTTVTIGWQPPPIEVLDYVHYYELVVEKSGDEPTHVEEAIHPQNSRNLPYMFDNLQPATEYSFRVRACSELTKVCGNWSLPVNGTTMDGAPSKPLNLRVFCRQTNVSSRSSVEIHWDTPDRPNGVITVYQTVLQGVASYRLSTDGVVLAKNETFGPKSKYEEKVKRTVYDAVPPNTNYTVRVTAITRNKQRPGEAAEASCRMPPTVPDQPLSKFIWGRVRSGDHSTKERPWMINLSMPRISERNGPICCYLVYIVKLAKDMSMQDLPHQSNMEVLTYHQVHNPNNTHVGAYIAEVVDGGAFQSKLFLGKGKRHGGDQQLGSAIHDMQIFRRCLLLKNGRYHWWERKQKRPGMPTPPPLVLLRPPVKEEAEESDEEGIISATLTTVGGAATGGEAVTTTTAKPSEATKGSRRRRRRQHLEQPADPQSTMPSYEVFDGPMDVDAYYTGFVEVIVKSGSGDSIMTVYSEYFDKITLGEADDSGSSSSSLDMMHILDIVVQILTGMIVLLVILLLGLCVIRRYHLKKIARMNEMGDESISLRDSLRALCGGGRPTGNQHRHLIGATSTSKPPDVAPIARTDMQQAFLARHKDSDYGFQQEFELLPDRFTDRTTKNSEAKENCGKNRYPDIKAYDQTRVKLNANGVAAAPGSDYVNANFVIGYKERKKFICAQGPMESTMHDFWRMVWEQHLEIMVMLTNLEEYNKTKCAKYWPEKVNDSQTYGDITVRYVSEERMTDYVVRELKVTKKSPPHAGENGGVTANGSSGGGGGDQMANSTSGAGSESEGRYITQYHYLMWKDFMAPEHPQGITRFIRQINSVYSVQRGPILVHCSAGVGRTGTLVALDSLLQQLEEENQVAIFNTVCDLRHQRNFLVQSLKQYIFLYRALTEAAVFGSTEIAAKDLGQAVEQMKQKPGGEEGALCPLEVQFQKLCNSIDDQMGQKKTTVQGASAENSSRNRDTAVLPYDRNRVILSPLSTREYSTYINASFIEGSDHSETFIVTQDPIADNTVGDLWRMVSEQSISTLIMMSEIGEGARKCPRYWADDEVQYDHILVKYIQSESCPYYTRREFKVTNCKIDDTIQVMQFQYNGWPTVEGEVPEVCRGIIELVDQAMKQQQIHANTERPVAVHCTTGTDRSSIFVAMCFLVQQLRTEKKVDICSVVRKLRSQRMGMIEKYAQYEFLHRAIVNYADLHKLSVESLVVSD